MIDVYAFADLADVIIGGIAVAPCEEGYKVANLNTGKGVAVFFPDGTLVETNMGDEELAIARRVLAEAKYYEEL